MASRPSTVDLRLTTMSGHESAPENIQVWCLLIDHESRPLSGLSVMVYPEANVEMLTVKIKAQSRHLASIDPNELYVWKLHKPRSYKDVICTDFLTIVKLLYELPEDEDEDETAQFLDPADRISLKGPWPEGMIHLLIQLPPDVSGNEPSEPSESSPLVQIIVGQCLVDTKKQRTEKRLRSASEEDGQAVKRKKIEGDVLDVQTRCVAIYGAIKAMPDNLDLSTPSTFIALPFPSPLPMPYHRFQSKEIDGIDHFEYMGRSQFHEFQKRLENKTFLKGYESLYLYGTSGSGKSHLLAALVYHLVREGKRVFYIPDCSSLLLEPAKTMRAAYHFAFYDTPVLGPIGDPDNVIRLLKDDKAVYIIVDQMNTLEVTQDDSLKERKALVIRWLDSLRFNHRYIFSASANEISNRDAVRKQSGISVFPMFGGMSLVR
jgi:hypothetical protein